MEDSKEAEKPTPLTYIFEDQSRQLKYLPYPEANVLGNFAAPINPTKMPSLAKITLSHCFLHALPDAFADLSITYLDLSFNRFQIVPECILNGLYKLELLNFESNQLRSFDFAPKCIDTLTYLNLEHNNLRQFPVWVVDLRCSRLHEFNFGGNRFSSWFGSSFKKATRYALQTLILRNCTGPDDFEVLKHLRTLRELDMNNCRQEGYGNRSEDLRTLFTDAHFERYLEKLNMASCSLHFVPDELSSVVNLVSLDVSNNELMFLPQCIKDLKNLEYLNVSRTCLFEIPTGFTHPRLRILLASDNSIVHVPNIAPATLLEVDFYNNQINSIDMDLSKIELIDLEQNFIDTCNDFTYEGYTRKLNAFRSRPQDNYHSSRFLNSKILEIQAEEPAECQYYSSGASLTDSDEEECDAQSSDVIYCDQGDGSENWDQNSDSPICISDSEFIGIDLSTLKLSSNKANKWNPQPRFLPDEIFQDAD